MFQRADTPHPPHHMWGGRFVLGPSVALDALNRSLPVDHRLWPQDVAASKAWVHALCRAGVLSAGEESQLLEGLDRVADKLADGAAACAPDEDVHTLVERLLYAEIGAVAGKLHTGRSRNDQVATDLRLWTIDAIDELDTAVAALGRTLVAKAKDGLDAILPGYTHGQRAQPVRWAYVLLAHAWPLVRDRQRLADARRRTAEMPLGSGALAGSGFPVDRVLLKEALGFRAVSANALDATGDRDFVAEVLFAIALVGTHLSRLARRQLQHRLQPDAAETQSGCVRAGARQGRTHAGRLRGAAHGVEGNSGRLSERLAGRQGVAVRRVRHAGDGVARRHRRDRHAYCERGADGGGARSGDARHRSRRLARRSRCAVPRKSRIDRQIGRRRRTGGRVARQGARQSGGSDSSRAGTGACAARHLGAKRGKPCHAWRCLACLSRVANRRVTTRVSASSELVNPSLAASCWSEL